VHLADGAVCGEPAVSFRYPRPLAWSSLPRPGDPLDDGRADPPAKDIRHRHTGDNAAPGPRISGLAGPRVHAGAAPLSGL